jgi:hypothetical protein
MCPKPKSRTKPTGPEPVGLSRAPPDWPFLLPDDPIPVKFGPEFADFVDSAFWADFTGSAQGPT